MKASDIVSRTIDILVNAEKQMNNACKLLEAMIGTKVYAIRGYGVQVGDPAWVLAHNEVEIERRHSDFVYPYEISVLIDGITYFSLMTDAQFHALVE